MLRIIHGLRARRIIKDKPDIVRKAGFSERCFQRDHRNGLKWKGIHHLQNLIYLLLLRQIAIYSV